MGLVAICTPVFTKYTPCFFWWFFFRKATETYEFRNDTCFLSVMLRNLAAYIIIPFLTYGMLWNLTNYATMLPFNFRCVTELYGLRIILPSLCTLNKNYKEHPYNRDGKWEGIADWLTSCIYWRWILTQLFYSINKAISLIFLFYFNAIVFKFGYLIFIVHLIYY